MNRLDAIRQRVERASPGPWTDDGDFGVASLDDAHFIAHSREDIPALLTVVEAAYDLHMAPLLVDGRPWGPQKELPSYDDLFNDGEKRSAAKHRLRAAFTQLLREENAG